jgi:hypothetical protein
MLLTSVRQDAYLIRCNPKCLSIPKAVFFINKVTKKNQKNKIYRIKILGDSLKKFRRSPTIRNSYLKDEK